MQVIVRQVAGKVAGRGRGKGEEETREGDSEM